GIGRRRRIRPQHERRAGPRRRTRAMGGSLLLLHAARRRARVLGRVLSSRQSAGRTRAKPLQGSERLGAVVVRRLRLFRSTRSQAGDERPAVSRHAALEAVMPSSSVHALLARAATALERGHGADAAQMLAPVLRSALTRDDELVVRAM